AKRPRVGDAAGRRGQLRSRRGPAARVERAQVSRVARVRNVSLRVVGGRGRIFDRPRRRCRLPHAVDADGRSERDDPVDCRAAALQPLAQRVSLEFGKGVARPAAERRVSRRFRLHPLSPSARPGQSGGRPVCPDSRTELSGAPIFVDTNIFPGVHRPPAAATGGPEVSSMARDLEVPVLIVGGGGAGLTASMLLSQLGVETWLASSLPTTSSLPKAHVLNQRAMEIMGDVGLAEEIYERGTPPANMKATAFYAGFAGPGADHGRMLMKMDCWGAGYTDIDWMAASPRRQSNLPQIRLEPILKRRAEELAPGRVHFHHEVTSLVQDERGATATILDRNAGSEYRVRAQYVLACDAGRTIGPMCGVEFEGARGIQNEVSIHLSADLSKWARDDDVLIRWIWVPERGALAVLVPMGPDHWGPESEEWVFHINYATDDPRALDDAKVIADMREALGIGDHPVDVHKVSRWSMEGVVASSFQVGRVFMVGDAAHRHPPTGGLGLTSGMHDAHNLCW